MRTFANRIDPSIAQFALLVGLISAASAGAAPVIVDVSTGTGSLDIVYRADAIKPFIDAAAARRVDIAGIGDSNQLFYGTGHDHGVQKAWADRFGAYGTGVLPFAGNMNSTWPNAGVGYGASGFGSYGWNTSTPPAELLQYALPPRSTIVGFPELNYAYLAAGQSISSAANHDQLSISPTAPISVNGPLRWDFTYAAMPGVQGTFQPSARIMSTNQTIAAQSITIPAGNYDLIDGHLDVPAGARNTSIAFEPFTLGSGQDLTGPFWAQYQRLESSDVDRGIAYSTLLAQGGLSAYDAATALQTASDTALGEWLRQSTRLQNGSPMLMVNINHGSNDLHATSLSVGPNPAISSTPEGFKDNLQAIVQRLRGVWTEQGYDPKNLFFVVGAYHPQPNTMDAFAGYEAAARSLADQDYNITVVNGTRLISPLTMSADGYYDSMGTPHLTPAGYENFDRLSVTQLVSAALPVGGLSDISSLQFRFSDDVSATLTPDLLKLVNVTTGQTISPADLSVAFDPNTLTATWTFPGLDCGFLPLGEYQVTLKTGSLLDGAGQAVNGGADYAYSFSAVPEPSGAALLLVSALLIRRRRAAR